MDDVRTPEEMLNEFELAVQLINSLFIFMMDNKGAGADNLLPAIIYCVIKAKPKRMLFNIKFINYFFNEKDKLGKRYCYVIQALSSFDFIMQKSKQDICKKENVDILLDDSLRVISSLRNTKTRGILFNSKNKPSYGCEQVSSWKEFITLIKEID